jgi:hypothetical protein
VTDPSDTEAPVIALAPRRALSYAAATSNQAAKHDWESGLIAPFLITTALDMCGLHGPEVDEACGVEEPTVDHWESGLVYPTWEQLCALATLTGFPPKFFSRRGRDMKLALIETSARFHRVGGNRNHRLDGPIVPAFLPEAIAKAVSPRRRNP